MIAQVETPRLTLLDPTTDPRWDRAVARHPGGTVFHTSAWARVIRQTYGHRPMYARIGEAETAGALVPVIEVESWLTGRRGVCLPFSDFCAPLLGEGADAGQVARAMLPVARDRKWKYFELRGGGAGPRSAAFRAHTVDLSGGAAGVFGRLDGSARRAVRKAERSNVGITVGRSAEAMKRFYDLHLLTRRRHGVPPQPYAFFANLWREILVPGLGFLVNAEWNGRPAAAAVFLRLGGHAIYKFSASDRRLRACRGNDLVLWEGIKALAGNGATVLHLGRTAPENEGLLRFKRGWATAEADLFYHRYDGATGRLRPARSGAADFSPRVFRLLPGSVGRAAGKLLYPHID